MIGYFVIFVCWVYACIICACVLETVDIQDYGNPGDDKEIPGFTVITCA